MCAMNACTVSACAYLYFYNKFTIFHNKLYKSVHTLHILVLAIHTTH